MFGKFLRRGEPAIQENELLSSRSIGNRLAILHILAVLSIFSAGSIFLYITVFNHLDQSGAKEIRAEAAFVRTVLQAPNGLELLKKEMETQRYESAIIRAYFRLLDQHGRIIIESTDMTTILPITAFPPPDGVPNIIKWRTPKGAQYLLKSAYFTENLVISKGGILQIGINITDDEKLSITLRNRLAFTSLAGLILAVLSAIYIIRNGLKPLKDISAAVHDITEHRLNTRINPALLPVEMELLASSFNSMLGRLESAFAKLAQYSENLAHELRTPLNNLMLEAEIALSRQRTPEEYRKVITSSMEEYHRLAQLIDRLLFLARADNHKLELAVKRIDVRQELESVAEFYAETACDKRVTVMVSGNASLSVDLLLFCRAISNLLVNAINYTPEGGTVSLAARQTEGSCVEIDVSDTGCGIDAEVLPKIFERYFWVEATREKDPKGTGLGLDIVKTIMELHGGSVAIRSEVGKGTTVTLMFPQFAGPVG